jgi:hypothetical protein
MKKGLLKKGLTTRAELSQLNSRLEGIEGWLRRDTEDQGEFQARTKLELDSLKAVFCARLDQIEKRIAARSAAEDFFFTSILPAALGLYVVNKLNLKTGRAKR